MNILTPAIASFRRRLLGFASKDPQFRREVCQFAKILVEELADGDEPRISPEPPFSQRDIASCRLKSETLSLIGTRLRCETPQLSAAFAELAEQAASFDCHLWMLNAAFSKDDLASIDALAGCFDTLAEALLLANEFADAVPNERRSMEPLLQLVADGQSALREAIRQAGGPEDPEQRRAFGWLREVAEESQTYVPRHMREDDPADPQDWALIGEQIDEFRQQRMAELDRQREIDRLLDDLFSLVSRLDDADEVGSEAVWAEVVSIVDDVVSRGLPPSSLELRELLRPHLASAPESPDSLHFDRVRRYCVQKVGPPSTSHDAGSVQAPSRSVEQVASLLEGQSVLLIGGNDKPHHKQAIKECFRLKDVIWRPTSHGTSFHSFEPHVANDDVAVVLLAIRWSSHAFGEVAHFCTRYGKPLVRLPGGYSPDQIAYQILEQCSERLGASVSEVPDAP